MLPRTTRELIRDLINVLGKKEVQKVFNVSDRQGYRYAADPRYTDDNQPNPFDKIIRMFSLLCEHDHPELIEQTLTLMGNPFDVQSKIAGPVVPDKPDLQGEIIDDHEHLNNFYNAMLGGAPVVDVDRLMEIAIDELRQDRERFVEQIGQGERTTQVTQGMHERDQR